MGFGEDLNKLDHLIEKLKDKKGGSKKVEKKEIINNLEDRHFKLVSVSGKSVEDRGRYELKSKTSSGKKQTRGPKDIASKVFTQLCSKLNKKNECKFVFIIQETTRNSKHKLFSYEGSKIKLKKPIIIERISPNGKKIKIEYKYKNVLKTLGSELPKNYKGGSVFYS